MEEYGTNLLPKEVYERLLEEVLQRDKSYIVREILAMFFLAVLCTRYLRIIRRKRLYVGYKLNIHLEKRRYNKKSLTK